MEFQAAVRVGRPNKMPWSGGLHSRHWVTHSSGGGVYGEMSVSYLSCGPALEDGHPFAVCSPGSFLCTQGKRQSWWGWGRGLLRTLEGLFLEGHQVWQIRAPAP